MKISFGQLFRIPAIAMTLLIGFFGNAWAQDQAAQDTDHPLVVTLLGTGTPGLNPERFGSAILVEAGDQKILFDAGRGATIRLGQVGLPPGELDGVFLTHLHSDHVNGLADIFLTGYIRGATLGGRQEPFRLFGPEGTQQLADGITLAHQWDIETRIDDERVPRSGTRIDVTELNEGVIFDANGLIVEAFPVDHGAKIHPALGYRVRFDGKTVVLSGDTTYDERIAEMARGADLLVHELGLATEETMRNPAVRRIIAHHTLPEDVGRIFTQAGPKLAVYSHMVLLGGVPISEVISRTRMTYKGPLVIGEDLMRFQLHRDHYTLSKAQR